MIRLKVIPEKEQPIKNLIRRKKHGPRKSRKARKARKARKKWKVSCYGIFRAFRVFRGQFFWWIGLHVV